MHYALVLYSLLVEVGRLDIASFQSYNKDGSTVELIGAEHSPGHAVTAGSLAQALSQGSGIAHARKLKGHTGRVVVYMSDGEFQEGQTWECVTASVFHKINNLTAVVDVNGQQCDGKMETVCEIGNLAAKLTAFGAKVHRVNGHNVAEIERAVKSPSAVGPTFVLCYTDPCKGFPLLRERAPKLHYVRFKDGAEKETWKKVLAELPAPDIATTTNGGTSMKGATTSTPKRKHETGSTEDMPIKKTPQVKTINVPATVPGLESCFQARAIETVTRPHRKNLLSWSKQHPRCITLTADLTASCEADLLRDELPNQYLSMGMAEQHMMSFAAGLAREGYHPLVQTFAVFVTRRPFDQVAMSIGVPNLPVRLLGFLPGITTPGGVTHQAIDDVALMRSIPNMRILEVGDASEVESVLDVADSIDGPVYIRMLRGEVPRLFDTPMKFGVVRALSEGTDVAVITTGICTEQAIEARQILLSSCVSILHLHLSTIVPFPTNDIINAVTRVKYGILTMENHSIIGGVGSATAEALAETGTPAKLVRLGLHGVYAHGASREYLMSEYGIDSNALVRAIEKLVGRKLGTFACDGVVSDASSGVKKAVLPEERPEDL